MSNDVKFFETPCMIENISLYLTNIETVVYTLQRTNSAKLGTSLK